MIVIPAGSHPDADQPEVQGWRAFSEPGHLDPPDVRREEMGAKITATLALLNNHVAQYRLAVVAETGAGNAVSRVHLNVRNAVRRFPDLARILLEDKA